MKRLLLFALVLLVGYVVIPPIWRSWRGSSLEKQGLAAFQDERWAEAARLFEKAAQYSDDSPQPWYNLGLARVKMGDLRGASSALKKAVSIDFNQPDTLLLLAYTQLGLGEYAGAEDLAEATLRFKPNSAGAYYVLGCVYAQTKRITNAIDAYRQSILEEPGNASARYNVGYCYANLNRNEEARVELEESVHLAPSDISAHLLLGRVYANLGNIPAADEQQRTLRKLDRRAAVELLEYIEKKVNGPGAKSVDASGATNSPLSSGPRPGDSGGHKTGTAP
ncbi:MAG TPA: tetratricopeptide repeat protein [Verrucomicrobiae bacterium]|nr:tetratricopeptide repeat protein [Verrucomicrobiae bacterium]